MSLFSKIFNSFKSIRLNTRNVLSGQPLNDVLISSMYAEQQSAYLNSYETGLNKSEVIKLLEQYWEIFSKEEAITVLQDLCDRNHDKNMNIVYDAFDDQENYVQILKSNLPSEENSFNYYLNVYRNLKGVVPELIEQQVITSFSEIKNSKDSGWNYGRGAFLARCCYETGYLTEKELKDYLEKTYQELKEYCSTWKEYTISYIFGRAIWGGSHNSGMILIANDLLTNEKSPLKNKTYL